MEKIKFVLIAILMVAYSANAQFRFGGEVGFYYVNFSGVNVLDSIAVNGTTSTQGELFFTVFGAQTIRKNLELLATLSVKPIYPTFVVYNAEATCTFCQVQKVNTLGITNLSLEILPQVNIPLIKWLKTKLFAGANMNVNWVKKDPDMYFDGKHEGVANVINSLDHSVTPLNVALVYGVSLEVKNVIASMRVQVKSPFTKSIQVTGVTADFNNHWQFTMISLGYAFQTKKNRLKY